MKKNTNLTDEDIALFKQALGNARQLEQDKIHPKPPVSKNKKQQLIIKRERQLADFYFSDEFEPKLPENGPMSFVREGCSSFLTKQLRRGDFYPDLILDLHGMTKADAKVEIASLIEACKKQHIRCACIMHGLGEHILKKKIPHWLVQHPDIQAFHQAPLEWGGNAALLVLVDSEEQR